MSWSDFDFGISRWLENAHTAMDPNYAAKKIQAKKIAMYF